MSSEENVKKTPASEKKPLTLGSLFDGLGGWPLAAVLNGVVPLWASEVEPFPMAVTAERFPDMVQLGDVTKINGAEVTPVDILCGGSPCFPAGTAVHTKDGVKPIETVRENKDFVLAEDGKYHLVTETMSRESDDIYKLEAQGLLPMELTGNHPVLVKHMKRRYPCLENGKRGRIRTFSEPEWIHARDLKKDDFVGFPIIKKETNPQHITEEEAWLIGRYIANGYIDDYVVVLCGGKIETHIQNGRLVNLCKVCGWNHNFKRFPCKYLMLPASILKEIIKGYMSYRNCFNEESGMFSVSVHSRELALTLQIAVHKAFHVPCKVLCVSEKPPVYNNEGKAIYQWGTYTLKWKAEASTRQQAMVDKHYIWQPVQSITKVNKTATVYNLEVDTVHSYTANGIVVHNCQNLSLAGKRTGLAGKESSLFFEFVRIVDEMKKATNGVYPKWCVWENVPGAYSTNNGNDIIAVLDSFEQAGYVVDMTSLDAQFMGVPQRRKRIFAVWHNVETIRKMETPFAFAVTTQLFTEIFISFLLMKTNLGIDKKTEETLLSGKLTAEGVRRKLELFHITGQNEFIVLFDAWWEQVGKRLPKEEGKTLCKELQKLFKEMYHHLFKRGKVITSVREDVPEEFFANCAMFTATVGKMISLLPAYAENFLETEMLIGMIKEVCIRYVNERNASITLFEPVDGLQCWDDYICAISQM